MAPVRALPPAGPRLLHLPPETLDLVMRHLLKRAGPDALPAVSPKHVREALPAALACSQMAAALARVMDAVCLPPAGTDDARVAALARSTGGVLRDIVLRSCTRVTDVGVLALAASARRLRSVDLSFMPGVTDRAIEGICVSANLTLDKVLVRRCERLTDRAAEAIGSLRSLAVVDLSYVPQLTDVGVAAITRGAGATLRMISVAHCPLLSDEALASIAQCGGLQQVCARALPRVTDRGFERLCGGIGENISGIDVLDCHGLTRDGVLRALTRYCPKVCKQMPENGVEARSLRHIIVTTLRSNIYIVQGCDPASGRDTIHMLLVDNGDIVSANILSAGTTDLSLLGTVLCKGYGTQLDQETKDMLASDYGILPSMLSD